MNKIFKKVFNAARGMMMVVNETTSSVQTGKKAAVTVAVVGALISGGALAATDAFIKSEGKYPEYANGGYIYVSAMQNGTLSYDETTSTVTIGAENGKISSNATGYNTFSALATDANKEYIGPTVQFVGDEETNVELTTTGSYSMVSRHGAITIGSSDAHLNSVSISGQKDLFYVTAVNYNNNQHDLKQKMEIYADAVELKAGSVDHAAVVGNGGSIKVVADSKLDIVGEILGYNSVYGGVDDMDYDINFTSGAKAVTNIQGDVESSGTSVVKIGLRGDGSTLTGEVRAIGHEDNIKTGGQIELAFGDQGTLNGDVVAKNGGHVVLSFGGDSVLTGNINVAKDSEVKVSGDATIADRHAANYGGAVYNQGTFEADGVTFEENGVKNEGYAYGGAINNDVADGNVTIKNSAFVGNYVESTSKPRGGAIDNTGKLSITNTIFEGNVAKHAVENGQDAMGGAIYNRGTGTITIADSKFIGNESSGDGGAISTNGGLVQFNGENEFLNNVAGKHGGAVDVQPGKEVVFDGKNTFAGNKAVANGGAINICDNATVTLKGEAVFSDNEAAQGNDIYNAGTLKIDGTTTLGSGIVNDGTLKLSDKTELIVGADSAIAGTFLSDKGAVLTLQDDATVSLDSKTDDTTNAGVIKNLTIQGQGDVVIAPTQTARALGIGVNTLDVGSVTIDIDGTNAKAVTAYGLNTIKADVITIDSEGDGIHAMGDANGKVTLTGGDVSIQAGIGGYAIQNAAGSGEETIVVTGKTVSLTSLGRTAISQQGDSSMRIEADNLTIEGFKDKYDSKVNAVNVTAGTLSLAGAKTVMISNGQGGADTNAIGVEAGGALSITGGNATVSGTTLVGGQFDMTADYNTLDALILTGNAQVSLDGVNKIKSIDYQAPKMRLFALRSTGPVLNLGGSTVIEDDTKAPTLNVEGDITHGGNVNVDNYNANGANVALNGSDNDLGNFNGNDSSITPAAGSDTQIGGFSGDNNTINLPDTETTITVTDDSATNTTVNAPGSVTDELGGDMSQLKNQVQGLAATFKGESGDVFGESTTVIDGKGNVVSQIVEKHQTNTQLAELTSTVPTLLARAEANDLRKRMGDIRAVEGTHGVWARYDGGKLSGATGLDYDFNKLQIGIDTVPAEGEPRLGLAFTYGKGDTDMARGASAENESFSLAAYGMWLNDNGQFVDVIARLGTTSTDLTTRTYNQSIDQLVASVSGEYGWRLPVNDMAFVEPSVELSYTHVTGETFVANRNTFEIDAYDSLVGRVGVAGGLTCPNNKGQLYVRAGVAHEFMGDSKFMATSAAGYSARPIENDGKDTWFEYAIGGQYNVNKNTYVYADVERTAGGDLDQDWRASVGVRYSF